MTKAEISRALLLAQNPGNIDFSKVDQSSFEGCALPDFQGPKVVTINQAAAFLRWQALQLNGEWDAKELQNCFLLLRKEFLLLGVGSEEQEALRKAAIA